MLNLLRRGAPGFELQSSLAGWTPPPEAIWLDFLNPTREEELAVEAALKLELPTPEEMAKIEPSSRLYQENGATFMTATLLTRAEAGPAGVPVTFVLARDLLITIRYHDLRAFSVFAERAPGQGVTSGSSALFGLLDAVIERLAASLEETGESVEAASAAIFHRPKGQQFETLLTALAGAQSVTSLARGSLVSLARLFSFAALAPEIAADAECTAHLKSLQRDGQSLTEHAGFHTSQITFLLDAALGLINIEQNGIIKFFSVAAVIFMPPTLVASIYGMNFHHMPELDWRFGYPLALGLMVASVLAPLVWFRRRGWF
ncbi:magnesium transporter CorA family protein [Phenylobacterium sp.]|uniref:magnesium transporter CorA family protein n=1 Tax=Phenylobacterium sp. TaxID=1871053 RepID=UPI00286BC3FC|nr:magnesium transporter CorA family protein [Phenylobacterium sp.]